MDASQKSELKKRILERIETAEKDIRAFQQLARPVEPDNAIGRLSRMEAINSKSINDAALAKTKQDLASLNRALRLIEDPDFGYCRICDEPIPFARLMALPETVVCVKCAE